MARIWIGAALVCVLAATTACSHGTTDASAPPAGRPAPPSIAAAGSTAPVGSAPTGSAPAGGGTTPVDPSAAPIVTGPSKPPGGGGVAAAPPPCSELKPVIDQFLTAARVTREAPGGVTTCYVIGQFRGAPVDAQLLYGHSTADQTVRKAAATGCAATVRPLKLPYKKAMGCDNPTATVHSGVALVQGGSFAAAVLTVSGGTTGSTAVRAAVADAAQKLAAEVLTQIG
jgi:hypothetical protein